MLQIPDYLTTYLVISFLLIVSKNKKEFDIISNIYSAVKRIYLLPFPTLCFDDN